MVAPGATTGSGGLKRGVGVPGCRRLPRWFHGVAQRLHKVAQGCQRLPMV